MDNLTSILQNNLLTQLVNGLYISDLNLSHDKKRVLIRNRICELQVSLNFNHELVQLLLDSKEQYSISHVQFGVVVDLVTRCRQESLNVFDTGRRIDLFNCLNGSFGEHVDATIPFLRRS